MNNVIYLLVRYKLNILRYSQVNQFDIRELLVQRLLQVHTVRLNGILWLMETYLITEIYTKFAAVIDLLCVV